jgi:Zn-dependent protease/predicted transcriptional regulator
MGSSVVPVEESCTRRRGAAVGHAPRRRPEVPVERLSHRSPAMKWSWKVARIAGIDVHVHATFLLLLGWIGLVGYRRTGTPLGALAGIGFVLLIFVIVLLHEYGHALAARRYGIPTRDITLLPIGGVARLERMPREPRQELVVALAGPAVNVVLALLLWVGLAATGSPPDATTVADDRFLSRGLAEQLLRVNVWLAAFNLIPAFPMDGGRVLRAVLAWRTGNYAAATVRAAKVGRFFALVFGLLGLFVVNNPMLVFVALFVWLGAAGEAGAVQEQTALAGVPLERVMMTDVRTLSPQDPLARATQLLLAGFQQDFPVVEGDGTVVGVLTRRDLMAGLQAGGEMARVADAMRRDFVVASPQEPIEDALARLQGSGVSALPVVQGRTLLGLVSLDNVGEFLMVRAALART